MRIVASLIAAIWLLMTGGQFIFVVPTTTCNGTTTICVSQSGAGTQDGTTSNSHTAAWFNTAGNWGGGGSEIDPGDTVIFNGNYSGSSNDTALTFQTSGSSGSPITLKFVDSSVTFSSAYWSTSVGAINGNGKSFITIDCNGGTITNTANGTSLANQQNSIGIALGTVNHDTVKNCNVTNIYVRVTNTANTNGSDSYGISLTSTGSNLIQGNTITHARYALWMPWTGAISGDEITGNTISSRDAGIVYASVSASNSTGVLIHDNTIGGAIEWDDAADAFHHDGIHFYKGGVNGVTVNAQIYNNTFNGNLGVHSTAQVFLEDAMSGTYVYNNIFAPTAGAASNAMLTVKIATTTSVYNNVFDGLSASSMNAIQFENSATGGTVYNNISQGNIAVAVYIPPSGGISGFTANTNDWNAGLFTWNSETQTNFTTWKTNCSCDASGFTTAPNLTAAWHPNSGSPVIATGTNLSSVGLSALNNDKAGTARPGGTAWDMGAFQF